MTFYKRVRVGSSTDRNGVRMHIFCEVELSDDGRLSIRGEVGRRFGDPKAESFGQIVLSDWTIDSYAPGWSAELVKEFRSVWDRWHLNDMRAGCEHQVGPEWDTSAKVEIVTCRLTSEALSEQREIKRQALENLANGDSVQWSDESRGIVALPWERTSAPDSEGYASGRYEVNRREIKHACHVTRDEHPRGFLSRPCPQCGYKYGHAWRREDVPESVLDFLRSLPSGE